MNSFQENFFSEYGYSLSKTTSRTRMVEFENNIKGYEFLLIAFKIYLRGNYTLFDGLLPTLLKRI